VSEKLFPIMGAEIASAKVCMVPWEFLAPHERQAKENHGQQTLEVLCSRGGLDPSEAVAILRDRRWQEMDRDAALSILYRKLADFYLERHSRNGADRRGAE